MGEAAGEDEGVEGFFTEQQDLAIRTLDRDVLLLAPAGTGKTQVITAKYVRVARRHGERSVIAITFTKKASSQLGERIREQADAQAGGRSVGWLRGAGSTIGTFHAIGAKVMREAQRLGLYVGPTTLANEDEQRHYAIEAVRQRRPDEPGRAPGGKGKDPREIAAKELLGISEKIKNLSCVAVEGGYARVDGTPVDPPRGLPAPGSRQHGDAVHLRKVMAEAQAVDFNDVILIATDILERHRESIYPNLKALLVDEYQDTNDPQDRMIDALSRGLHLTCVGDDDQAIFEWRGANVENIRQFGKRRPEAVIITLDVNYRCPREILVPALSLIGKNKDRHAKPLKAGKASTSASAIRVHDLSSHYRNASVQNAQALKANFLPRFTAQVCRDIVSGGVAQREVACLVRTNSEADAITVALREMGLQAKVTNPNATSSKQLRRMTAWLRVLENPRDLSAVATLTESRGGDASLMDLADSARLAGVPVADHVRELADGGRLRQARFRAFAEAYASYKGMQERERPSEVVTHVAEAESQDMRGVESAQVTHYWRAYTGVMERVENAYDLDAGIEYLQTEFYADEDGEDGEDVIEVVTTHSMKGRQKRVVVISAFINGVFPLGIGRSSETGLAEERRLAYVAMTRAQEQLHIVSTSNALTTFLTDAGLSFAPVAAAATAAA